MSLETKHPSPTTTPDFNSIVVNTTYSRDVDYSKFSPIFLTSKGGSVLELIRLELFSHAI